MEEPLEGVGVGAGRAEAVEPDQGVLRVPLEGALELGKEG